MPKTIPFVQYVFSRLQQLNCHSIHGVPGDFFLRALDHTRPALPSGPRWIGNASELCAGYAADGYARAATQIARQRGIDFSPTVGALFTTYGVGELSAINAVAGSYAESIPVVHLVGTPSRQAMLSGNSRRPIHHSLGDGRMDLWAEMAKNITCAQAWLHAQRSATAAAEVFDDVLEQAVAFSQPVYASFPSDLIDVEVPADMLHKALSLEPPSNHVATEDELIEALILAMQSAESPLIIADSLSYPLQLAKEISELVQLTSISAMSYMSGKGIVEESHPSWDPAIPNTTEASQNADLVIYFGPLLADTNTARWSAIPSASKNWYFDMEDVQCTVGNFNTRYEVRSKEVLGKLVKRLKDLPVEQRTATSGKKPKLSGKNPKLSGNDEKNSYSRQASGRKITQDEFWPTVSSALRPHETILLANGTPLIGGRALKLQPNSTVIASSIWCSIGHMLPAAQGVAAAKADHGLPGRTILFEGDGSFQVTCQSISDIIRNQLDVTIFLINNKGYTYERWLNGMEADYNDVPAWRYADAGKFFGGSEAYMTSARIKTFAELLGVIEQEKNSDGQGLRIYEVLMDPADVPEKSRAGLLKASEALSSS